MVFVTADDAALLARLGNQPGQHKGDVEVTLPNGTVLTCRSRDLTVTADCLAGRSKEGRSFAVLINGTILLDADDADSREQGTARSPAAGD